MELAPLHVRDKGEGPCVLFIHAGIVDGSAWMPAARSVIDSGYRTLVVDIRGFGDSPDPDAPYSHAGDMADVLDAHGVEQATLVGWSMGGVIACEVAHLHPHRVDALALVNCVPPGFDRSPKVLDSWKREEALYTMGDIDGLVENELQTWVAGPSRSLDQVDPTVCRIVEATARNQVARWKEEFESLRISPDITAQNVADLPQPLLLLGSDLDHEDHRAAALQLLEAHDDATWLEIEGCAHAGPLEMPGAYGAMLAGFLELISGDATQEH
jgi:pimeloyl-ACP methyl ester carboxylesterase